MAADELDVRNFLTKEMEAPKASHLTQSVKAEIIDKIGANAQGM